jgi:plastocyanin
LTLKPPAILLFILTALAAVTPASQRPGSGTGSLRGRVELRNASPAQVPRPNVADVGAADRRKQVERPQAVVYLETAPRGAFEQAEPGHATLDQRNETFVPHVLAITTGTVVNFPNSDHLYHNVFSLSKAARFDLGRYAAGKSKSVRFDKPGIVRVFCDIHSHMNAFILVFSHPFFAVTDDEGRYRIDNVPSGTYTIVAWSDRGNFDPRTVTITDGAVAQLDFAGD